MGDRSGMSISADSPLDETLNQGLLALLLQRQYQFDFGINIVQFSIFIFNYMNLYLDEWLVNHSLQLICAFHPIFGGPHVWLFTDNVRM